MATQNSFDTIIIGCGISGACVAYHLSLRKNAKILVVDKGDLYVTGGSTSHAPGGVLPFSLSSRIMTRWGNYSSDFYESLGAYYKTGIIVVARTDERMKQYKAELEAATQDNFPYPPSLVSKETIAQKIPGINVTDIKGGLLYPSAGRADAIKAITKMCDIAKKNGVIFRGKTNVASLIFDSKKFQAKGIKLSSGEEIFANKVVLAAGAWGRNLYPLPIVNIEHPMAFFDWKSADLKGKSRPQELPQNIPGVFDFDGGQYYTEHDGILGIGNYNHNSIIVSEAQMKSREKAENPFTPVDFTKVHEFSVNLFPGLSGKKMLKSLNGFMTYTKDGYPYVGPVPGIEGLWAIECVWITHAPGAGKSLADWISAGIPNPDEKPYIHYVDPARFSLGQGFGNNYDEVEEIVRVKYLSRCALPDYSVVEKNRKNPKIPFTKKAAL